MKTSGGPQFVVSAIFFIKIDEVKIRTTNQPLIASADVVIQLGKMAVTP
jgi:hypothetical protein